MSLLDAGADEDALDADRWNSLTITLRRLRDDLDGCIGCGCLSLERCTLYNAQDKAAARGAGPRYLMGDRSDEIGEVGEH